MYQTITIVGRLGRDPEMRVMPNGENVTALNVATDRSYMKGQERVKETTWFRVSIFGKQAENANKYLTKGKMVLVEGRLRADPATGGPATYTDKSGKTSASFEIVASNVTFLSPSEAKTSNDDLDF